MLFLCIILKVKWQAKLFFRPSYIPRPIIEKNKLLLLVLHLGIIVVGERKYVAASKIRDANFQFVVPYFTVKTT
jgi:hypothetical protein